MPSHTIRRATLAALLAVLVPVAASAQYGTPTASAIIPVANSPVVIQNCRMTHGGLISSWDATITLGNRTKHELIAADAQFTLYDTEGSKISQISEHFSGFEPISTRDTGVITANLIFDNMAAVANNPALISKISCKILGAQFTGEKRWQLGQTWPEQILSIQSESMIPSGGGGGAGSAPAQSSQASKYSISVVNSWNDSLQGYTFVHDTLNITGGDADVTLRGSDLLLTMTVGGGARKTYIGLTQPAPTYQKINPLGSQTTTAYEVQPATDLGRLGAITVPAHTTVTTTVTFAISDPVLVPTDNRTVTAR